MAQSGAATDEIDYGGADGPYWRALAEGRLTLQCCGACGHWKWPAGWRCGRCGSEALEWREVSPEGRVFSWTTTWHRFEGTESFDLPYTTVLGALPAAGGRRLLGLFEGEPASLAIEAPILATISRVSLAGRNWPALRWRLAQDSSRGDA